MNLRTSAKRLRILPVVGMALLAGGAVRRAQDQCGPFADVSPTICPYVFEMYVLGITAGTSPTTYSPDATVTRGQAAVFVSKGVNQAIARSSRRALGQWWTTWPGVWSSGLGATTLPSNPGPFGAMVSDGTDVWVAGYNDVFRVRASDGRVLETWSTGKTPFSLLVAMGRVFIAGFQLPSGGPGTLYMIDPSQSPGDATAVADLPSSPFRLAFDGARIWATLEAGVAILTPGATIPWTVETVADGFQAPSGIMFDGLHMWVTDTGPCSLLRLDAAGAVQQTVATCSSDSPAFDGSNLLVPSSSGLQVVRASDGAVITTHHVSTGLSRVVFDGERILIIWDGGGQSYPANLTLLRAADLSVLQEAGFSPIGEGLGGGTTDGTNFWLLHYGGGSGSALVRY
jgi:hypothetical protein